MKVFIVLEKKKWEEMKEEINKIPNDKISDETVKFLKDNPEGSVKDLPKDLKKFFIESKTFDEKFFNEVYNFDGDINEIKKGMILYDDTFSNEFTVNEVVYGVDFTFLDVEEHEEAMLVSEKRDERFRLLKIKK